LAIDPAKLVVRTILNGLERQNYPISDMIVSAQQLVSNISHDMTLLPGDLICCGTSTGVGAMKEPVNTVTVAIDGIWRIAQRVSAISPVRDVAGLQIAARGPRFPHGTAVDISLM
jgi:2-keto-4-pentenoate hydratase/2-oxohepta-3-ene-1,7-dioic acid hydratase in catechol pathway